jgi:phosphoribosylformylglycinamidine (FGAM) synthase-like enzyme
LQNERQERTTIAVSPETRRRLILVGEKGKNFDEIIGEVLDKARLAELRRS